ncbi:hypothetical protein [Dialister succinatiphilus]|uniref:hypothetical protein n=1 Tax=Dialister succinatiphilus TaxID=487173 RepID=UPI004024EE6F
MNRQDETIKLMNELENLAQVQSSLIKKLTSLVKEEPEGQSKKDIMGAVDFSSLHIWLREYNFNAHFMKDKEGRDDYIRLLLLAALMMRPFTEHLEEGLSMIEQLQEALGGKAVEELLPEVMELDKKGMEKVIYSVIRNEVVQSFLIDSLLLYGEMKKGEDKAEVTRQLSALYNLLGADGQLIAEAADAVSFIEKGDQEGLLEAAGAWEELNPVLPKAYLGMKTAYTAVWPKRLDDVDADTCPAYANNLILKTMVNEGDAVDEGDILFVIYGGHQRGKRDIDKSHKYGTYGKKNNRVYTFDALYYDKQKNWMYVGIEGEEADSSALGIDENYEKIVVKAACRGIVHYSDDICALPFQDIISSWRDIRRTSFTPGFGFNNVPVELGSKSYDPHIKALNNYNSTAQPVVSKDEYYRSGSILSLGNVSSSVICTITPVK